MLYEWQALGIEDLLTIRRALVWFADDTASDRDRDDARRLTKQIDGLGELKAVHPMTKAVAPDGSSNI